MGKFDRRKEANVVLGINDICEEYGLSRKMVTRYLNSGEIKILPRIKGEPYYVTRKEWERFLGLR